MQSQDRLADFLRAYVKEEAPSDIWRWSVPTFPPC